MIVLAMHTCAPQSSVALTRDGRLVAEVDLHLANHRSSDLLPTVEWILKTTGTLIDQVDLFACAAGPGSFTGLRIGMATCLGLATANQKPCVGVSALESAAYPYLGLGSPVAAVLDARKKQVYVQTFEPSGEGGIEARDAAVSIRPGELGKIVREPTMLIGDGAELYRREIAELLGDRALFPPSGLCYHRAHIVAKLAEERFGASPIPPPFEAIYVRPPDAKPMATASADAGD
ncbi:MAG: tRNA (adenosine(37)-N6)-threonylcarbamoyltransferase complex dimerization subunit type 1 TsaB [Deltaproteobacteria bacterium]|nr:tRNA (adenosine(37)-N6)-threonylcarbamoyltransferase complex dimerization subunit type 1 TsaB [Deltaproteobacteria bacterium]MCB9488494.1 tRNA (adenosine(37)-N6)-threonylcarbamoyltransferase complex dimerization subunit type 1 TsaB [Deltaproteobacteria bacterium]